MTNFRRHALALALIVLASCGGGPTEPSDYEFGRIDVFIRDTAGQPVNGVAVRMERPTGQVEDEGGVTGTLAIPGYFFFLRVSGDFRIVITPPAGYKLAAGQSPTQAVTFSRNQTKTINFVLTPV